tara:strand:+ start:148 stop:813 length:666 start_codon:yes stop_codon:yes gene_type:complete
MKLSPSFVKFTGAKTHLELLMQFDFCTLEECNRLCKAVDKHAQPSVHLDLATGKALPQQNFRRSNTLVLHPADPLCFSIVERMAGVLEFSPSQAEPPNIIKYQPGDYFKPHVDGFSPIHFALAHSGASDRLVELNTAGNRTWTLMLYLNDDFIGGQTTFPLMSIAFIAKTGLLVGWKNTHSNEVIPESLHQSTELISGYKYVFVVPFRENDCDHDSTSYYL